VPIIQPLVPLAHREMLIRPDVVLAGLMLGGDFPIGVVVRRVGVVGRLEQNRLAVGAPFRDRGARREVGEAAGLATRGEVEDVDLLAVVALPLGREGDGAAIGRPGDAALGSPCVG